MTPNYLNFLTMLQTKPDYQVFSEKGLLYSGNNAFHAHQAFFSVSRPRILIKGQIQTAVLNHITALSERLN